MLDLFRIVGCPPKRLVDLLHEVRGLFQLQDQVSLQSVRFSQARF